MSSEPDRALPNDDVEGLDAISSVDPAVYHQYRQMLPHIEAALRRRGLSHTDAEDAAETALLITLRRRLDVGSRYWCYYFLRAAYRAALDLVRQRKLEIPVKPGRFDWYSGIQVPADPGWPGPNLEVIDLPSPATLGFVHDLLDLLEGLHDRPTPYRLHGVALGRARKELQKLLTARAKAIADAHEDSLSATARVRLSPGDVLEVAIQLLPARQREVFQLHLKGLDHSAVTEELRINNGDARTNLSLARKRLRALLSWDDIRLNEAIAMIKSGSAPVAQPPRRSLVPPSQATGLQAVDDS